MNGQQLFNQIDSLTEEYLRVWEDVCNIESPSRHKAGVDAVGKYFSDMAAARGWEVEIFSHAVSGDVVCITMNPTAKGEMVCISGHMDTVHPLGSFGSPAVRIEGDRIYGPGVTDCKGGIVAGFLAMDALSRLGFSDRPVRLLLQSDEEVSSMPSNKETIGYICRKAEGATAFLNLENDKGHGNLCLARKGIVTFDFTVHGVAGHSSRCAIEGANAILEAAHKIIELEKIKDNDGLTCCCSVISGGTVPNTIPDFCRFQANVRFANTVQYEWMCQKAKEVAETVFVPGCRTALETSTFRVAMEEEERNRDLLARMNRIYREVGLPEMGAEMNTGGSDAADVASCGIPCVDSIGVYGEKIHSVNEWASIPSLAKSAKYIASAIAWL